MSCANSPVNCICEGCVTCRKGILFRTLVSHCDSFFQLRFKPQMVLFSGSSPIDTFDVSACSDRCISVPPRIRSFEKSYSQFTPYIVLRCIP